jgi:hypothetical protein
MQIIDKNRDYYDYVQFRFGQEVDKTSTFDRRGSAILAQQELIQRIFQRRIASGWGRGYDEDSISQMFFVEAGFKRFVIRAYDAVRREIPTMNPTSFDYEYDAKFRLFQTVTSDRHLGPTPLTLVLSALANHEKMGWRVDEEKVDWSRVTLTGEERDVISDPIFRDTKIPSVIGPDELFDALDVYTRRLNDDKEKPEISDDRQKAVNHGVDPKTGFRGRWWEP